MQLRDITKRVFKCSFAEHNGNVCPVAVKFKENNKGYRPIPEAYLGNPRSRLMIIGINPGQSENYLSLDFELYQRQLLGFLKGPTWRRYGGLAYDDLCKILGHPQARERDEVIITDLVHCPTPSWSQKPGKRWELSDDEKKKSIELCSRFSLDIVERVNPEVILLHGPSAIKFFSDLYGWNINDPESTNIIGTIKKGNGRNFVLSIHPLRLAFCSKNPQKPSHRPWRSLEEAAERLKKERS